jgi:uncharacterized protein YndB with AHSA1/START domain
MQSAGATLEAFYRAVGRRDLAAARQFVDPELVFYGLFETYPSADAYLAALAGLLSITTRLDVKTIIAQGEDAAVFFELDTTAPAEATTLVAEWHKVRGGKIVQVRSAFDGRPFERMFTPTNREIAMFDILHRVGIAAPPQRVFEALSTRDGLAGWWVGKTTGDPLVGGTIDFEFCKMRVLESVAGQRVRWCCTDGPQEWVGTEVSFVLSWRDEQTYVLFKHAGWKEPVEFMHHCSTKWATFLLSLRDHVERGAGHPVPRDVKIHVGD